MQHLNAARKRNERRSVHNSTLHRIRLSIRFLLIFTIIIIRIANYCLCISICHINFMAVCIFHAPSRAPIQWCVALVSLCVSAFSWAACSKYNNTIFRNLFGTCAVSCHARLRRSRRMRTSGTSPFNIILFASTAHDWFALVIVDRIGE